MRVIVSKRGVGGGSAPSGTIFFIESALAASLTDAMCYTLVVNTIQSVGVTHCCYTLLAVRDVQDDFIFLIVSLPLYSLIMLFVY